MEAQQTWTNKMSQIKCRKSAAFMAFEKMKYRMSSTTMKATTRSVSIAFLSIWSVASADPPKVEAALPTDGVFVTYGSHNMVIELKDGKFRFWFSSDMKGSDVEGLEGTYTSEGDQVVLTHPKLFAPRSNWTVRSIDGVVTLWRSDALKLWADGKLDIHHRGKEKFFLTGGGSILVPSKKTAEEAWKSQHLVVFLTEAEALVIRQKEDSAQGEAGQPATRSESESQRIAKPEPESEGPPR